MIPRNWFGKWVLCLFLGISGYFLIARVALGLAESQDGWGVQAATEGFAGAFWLFWYWAIFRNSADWDSASLQADRVAVGNLFSATIAGACLAAIVPMAYWLFGKVHFTKMSYVDFLYPIGVAFGTAVFEEILFRGFLFQAIRRAIGILASVLVVAFLFTLVHFPLGTRSPISVFLFSIFFTLAFLFYRSLWIPIGLHFGWDLIAIWQGGSQNGYPGNLIVKLTTGVPQLVETAVGALALMILFAIWLYRKIRGLQSD